MYVTDFDEFLVNEPCSCQHLELPPDLSQSASEKGGGPCLESARGREYFFPCTTQRMSDEAGTASGTTRELAAIDGSRSEASGNLGLTR